GDRVMAVALVGATVFDGARLRDGVSVVIDDDRIGKVIPDNELPSGIALQRVTGLLAPGFIDIQVNGGGGVLFNDQRTIDGIRATGAAHRRCGTTGFLPTLITDTRAHMAEAVAAAGAALQQRVPGMLGVHLEGPFLNPERKGIHRAALMRPIGEEDVAL